MGEAILMQDITTVKAIYSAINQGNSLVAVEYFDPQAVRIEFEGTPSEGTFRGQDELLSHFSQNLERWAEGSCEPEETKVINDRIVVSVYVRVRLKDKSEWNEGRVTDVFTFRDGKVIEFRSFFTKEGALEFVNSGNQSPRNLKA